jgi:AcrR family transcriptional regulator
MKRNGHQARGAILAAAMRLFAEQGYAGTSTRAICQAAGITKPVLYYHFRSKEHLYQELMIDSFGQFQKALLRASKVQGPLRQRLIRVVHEDLKSTLDDPLRVQFVFRMIFSPERQRPEFNALESMERQRDFFAGIFREGIASGLLQGDPRHLATMLMGINLVLVLEHLFTGRPTLTRRNAQRVVDTLLEGCSVK